MNKTKVDDILIEMISPKVKEIEERFSRGEGLTNEDVITLLLKSQYNHINHLNTRLDDVTRDVAQLKTDFAELKTELKTEFAELKTDFAELKTDFAELKAELKTDFAELKTEFANQRTSIQETINNTMKWYIGSAGIVIIVLKALDLFIK